MKNAIVLVVDRLNAGFLGPYGNTWVETPGFNRLAAESALFEFALSDSPDLPTVYRSLWSGLHAMSGPRELPGLADQSTAAGIHTTLITDAEDLAEHPLAGGFQERIVLPGRHASAVAAEIGETRLARLLAEAVNWLEREPSPRPFLLWIHARGMQGPWDAPADFREQFADEDDPPPPQFVEPPVRWVEPDEDPDRILGIMQAYAGQVSLLDACLDVFLDAYDGLRIRSETLLVVTSPRCYPLGEHRRIGPVDQAIYGEHLHVPCLVRYPNGDDATVRCHELVQPSDIHATLREWLSSCVPSASGWGQSLTAMLRGQAQADRACAVAGSFRALRTPAWFLHCEGDRQQELFAKPDDRWEANEVSDRCRDLLPQLTAIMNEFELAAKAGSTSHLSPMPHIAKHGLD
ncbi:MAG: sulfatase-like hydrolase/transferase [Planctomycetes bacterium]|nr:sulfatase-like hydrolase/transferase [Planctomycetota bacterium]